MTNTRGRMEAVERADAADSAQDRLRHEMSSMCDELRDVEGRDAEALTQRIRDKAAEIRGLRSRGSRRHAER